MKGIISSQNRRMILLCSGRLYIAALRIFLIGPGARHRYQRHHDRRREVPPWLAIFRQGLACSIGTPTMALESAEKPQKRSSGPH
jgi:hypothetical protein